jgi:hypothetical protein
VSGQVWTAERGWHVYATFGCGATISIRSLKLDRFDYNPMEGFFLTFSYELEGTGTGEWHLLAEALGRCIDKNGVKLGRRDGVGGTMGNRTQTDRSRLTGLTGTLHLEAGGSLLATNPTAPPVLPIKCAQVRVGAAYFFESQWGNPSYPPRPSPEAANAYLTYTFDSEVVIDQWFPYFTPCPDCLGDW